MACFSEPGRAWDLRQWPGGPSVSVCFPCASSSHWAAWVNDNVIAQTKAKAAGTTIIPVFDCDWRESEYRQILDGIRRDSPAITTLSWFVHGQWTETIFQRIARLRGL